MNYRRLPMLLMASAVIAGSPRAHSADIMPGAEVLLLGFVDDKAIALFDDSGKRYELGKVFCFLDRNSRGIPARLNQEGTRFRVTLKRDGREIPLYVSPANVRTNEGLCTPSAASVPITERGGDRHLCTSSSNLPAPIRLFKAACR